MIQKAEYKEVLRKLKISVSADEKADTCAFRSSIAERYCLATSHMTCLYCRFYEPTSAAMVEILASDATRKAERIEWLECGRKSRRPVRKVCRSE